MKKAYLIAGIVVVLFAAAVLYQSQSPAVAGKTFSSVEELKNILEQSNTYSNERGYNTMGGQGAALTSAEKDSAGTPAPTAPASDAASTSSHYGTTNVQVENVDEPDIMKNDGRYLYVVSEGYVSIIDPSSQSLISKIKINGTVQNIFISNDKLIVFGQESYGYGRCFDCVEPAVAVDPAAPTVDSKIAPGILPTRYGSAKSFILVYDISSRSEPIEEQDIVYDGFMYDARMIGSRVYAITQQPIFTQGGNVVFPAVAYRGAESKIALQDISYFGVPDSSYQLTTIFTFDASDSKSVNHATFLTGSTQTIYVSENNLYLASQKYLSYPSYEKEFMSRVYLSSVDSTTRADIEAILARDPFTNQDAQEIQERFADYYNHLSQEERDTFNQDISLKQQDFDAWVAKETQKTIIDKIALDGSRIDYIGKAEVPGTLINQFALDENKGYLRIATTTGDTWSQSSLNHVYVLDADMNVVGSLENLAKTERIYAVRFIGDRAYMVTFKQIDPLFVIDLSDETNPRVLGELKIPGYSTYLHPYDATHLIGIGQDTSGDIQEGSIRAAVPAGLKIALFDVSDVEHPQEIAHTTIGSQGTYSQALYDHKAFLFDSQTGLLALPVNEYASSSNYGSRETFNGLYVYHLDTTDGFTLKGKITHLNASELVEMSTQGYASYGYEAQIARSTYIDETLYTLSPRTIQGNSLSTFEKLFSINLPRDTPNVIYYAQGGVNSASSPGNIDAVTVAPPSG